MTRNAWESLRIFLRENCPPLTNAWILSGNKARTKHLGLARTQSIPLHTGDQDLRFLQYIIRDKTKYIKQDNDNNNNNNNNDNDSSYDDNRNKQDQFVKKNIKATQDGTNLRVTPQNLYGQRGINVNAAKSQSFSDDDNFYRNKPIVDDDARMFRQTGRSVATSSSSTIIHEQDNRTQQDRQLPYDGRTNNWKQKNNNNNNNSNNNRKQQRGNDKKPSQKRPNAIPKKESNANEWLL
jgi:hypothetical protein